MSSPKDDDPGKNVSHGDEPKAVDLPGGSAGAKSPDWPVVYYDTDCPMCRSFVDHLGGPNPESSAPTNFKSLRNDPLPSGLTKDGVEKEIHVTDEQGHVLKGAPAVLYILERHQKFLWLVRLGRLPVIRSLGNLVYAIIAANRFGLFGPHARVFWSKIVLCLAFLIPMPITWKLFIGESVRYYPTTPVAKFLPPLPAWVDYLAFYSIIISLVLVLFTSRPKKLLTWFLLVSGIFSLWDQSRWMPYYVEFWWMFAVLRLFPWHRLRESAALISNREETLNTLGAMLCGIWFWSGAQKINARYLAVGFPWMVSPFTKHFSSDTVAIIHALGVFSPVIESGAALLMLFAISRPVAVLLVTAMHLWILIVFGPLGLNINHSVWSWNVAHIILVWLIFWRRPQVGALDLLVRGGLLKKFLVTLFCVLPVLNFLGRWDDFMSHALYSWSTTEAEIEIKSPEVKSQLPAEVRANIRQLDGREFVHVLEWSYWNFQSPPYHSDRVFKGLLEKLCKTTSDSPALELVIYDRPNWKTGVSPKRRFNCMDVS